MEFPVSNKQTALLKTCFIMAGLVIVLTISYLYMQSNYILYIAMVILIPTAICSAFYIKKQNIKSLMLDHDKLLVSYKKEKIKIPLTKIQDISHAINFGLDHRFRITQTYTLTLNTKYYFGNKILIDYEVPSSQDNINKDEDPVQIKVLKQELKRIRHI